MASDDLLPSQYVKLQHQNITEQPETEPGELSQPVDVPQLNQPRCPECGQVLPQAYVPPQDEPWSSSIFQFADDPSSLWQGLFCPCVLFGKNVEALKDVPWTTPCLCHAIFVEGGIALAASLALFNGSIDPGTAFLLGEGLVFAWWMCGIYTGLFRNELQKKYHLMNSPCDPCIVHCCLHPCALCQEHREMKNRLPEQEPPALPLTVINAPPEQEMSAAAATAAAVIISSTE
eukprot:TRINITY_DN2021_c0_g1_i1.p1 TRINITY_DN2021_c0_g1~~TRINITY_DN2021_c0_g1_i1.p1  ORF type:complete len:232 (-),score=55.66 TRINITY_DN2021_c0_g1_i1:324-1019(-)